MLDEETDEDSSGGSQVGESGEVGDREEMDEMDEMDEMEEMDLPELTGVQVLDANSVEKAIFHTFDEQTRVSMIRSLQLRLKKVEEEIRKEAKKEAEEESEDRLKMLKGQRERLRKDLQAVKEGKSTSDSIMKQEGEGLNTSN